jgi:ABC-type branched-subunit amino acid transport system ATPase component
MAGLGRGDGERDGLEVAHFADQDDVRILAERGAIHKGGVSIALVEQNANEALAISDKAYILVDGRNSRTGNAKELAEDPEIRRIFLGG